MNRSSLFVRTTVAAVALAFVFGGTLSAQEPAKQPQSTDPHAGHNHAQPASPPQKIAVPANQIKPGQPAQLRPGEQPPNPAPNAAKGMAGAVKPAPGQDIPAPTVVLKEGEVPAIKFDTPTYDFGRVRSGQEVTHDFWFTNTGTGPVEILKVRPSCGCTTAGQHDKIVQPSQTGKIPMRLNPGNASGPIHKTVMVNTNVPGEGATITLHIQGEVWHPIQATPTSASFGRLTSEMASSASMERKLTIVNNTEDKVTVSEAKSSNPSFKATVNTLEEGKKYELVVTVVPPLASGPVTGNIELTTTLADMPKMLVPVNAYVTADVDVTPNQLTLPSNRNGNIQRQFFIRNNTPNPIKVSDLASTNENLKLSIIETQPVGKAYRLTVDIPQEYAVASGGDKITLKTDNTSVPMLTIPINSAPSVADVTKQFGVTPNQTTPGAAGGAAAVPVTAGAQPGGPAVVKPATPPVQPVQPPAQPAGSGTPAAATGK